MVQLSVFTLRGFDVPIDNLKSSDQFLIKFKISKSEKDRILEELKHLGIRLSTIFPDLDHLADEISRLEFKEEELRPKKPNGSETFFTTPGYWGRTITNRGGEPST